MKKFGAFSAKTHFSEILKNVTNGEKFVITKNGMQVAMIIPFNQGEAEVDPIKDAIRAIKKLRKGVTLGKKLSIRKMLEMGRQ